MRAPLTHPELHSAPAGARPHALAPARRANAWLLLALSAAWFSVGCSSKSTTRELINQQNDLARIECDCTFADDGYASAAECRDNNIFPIPGEAIRCADSALRADSTGAVLAATRCLLDAGAIRLECLRSANCDDAASAQCERDSLTELALCPEPSDEAQSTVDVAIQTCVRGSTGNGPEVNGCPEDDLGSATGASVATGLTTNGDNDLASVCGGDEANDTVFSWVAPQTGSVTIDTFGSDYDTILYVLEGTCSAPIARGCNDDEGVGLQSQVVVDVVQGEALIIVVDGFANEAGDFVLNINY